MEDYPSGAEQFSPLRLPCISPMLITGTNFIFSFPKLKKVLNR